MRRQFMYVSTSRRWSHLSVDVHGTAPADPLPARSPKGQCGILLVLDLDQGIQHHRRAILGVDLVVLPKRRMPSQRGIGLSFPLTGSPVPA